MATKKMAMGGMGKKMAGVAKAAAGKAAEAGKAKEAQKSAMADKMKSAYTDFMAKKSAAPYSEASRQANMKANPGGGGGGIGSVPPTQVRAKLDAAKAARPMGGGMGTRAGMTRPARPMGGMGMKKGGKAGKK